MSNFSSYIGYKTKNSPQKWFLTVLNHLPVNKLPFEMTKSSYIIDETLNGWSHKVLFHLDELSYFCNKSAIIVCDIAWAPFSVIYHGRLPLTFILGFTKDKARECLTSSSSMKSSIFLLIAAFTLSKFWLICI